ncbi:MAG TPA: PEP-CTERM sorting domain-containing protein [Oscillatoriales cyanobacterium M59_W2019_021]|nr:MAG: PEP-CTERM sorting domain-containing protein [Cyanobacteria bacterium J055]HIK32078.1 PEP-CTERM sorting domain-containing protein [Oscillatoriales cyanobacterium M4454_W2019_049]HIK51280.1 PEP-CTERM sorting domain-containing protein [Oscillatoriales cyanobacterium M59_W2019_021]
MSAVLATILIPNRAFSISISATAQGNLTPPTAIFPDTVTNGDFLISANDDPDNFIIGDGQEENTRWTLDFTQDPNWVAFSTTELLTSAKLTLTLTTCCNIETDEFRIQTLPSIATPSIQSLPRNTTQTIELELLDFYSSSDILGVFNRNSGGLIPMTYFDDALVSFARLELSNDRSQSVPEPSLILGIVTMGAIGSFATRRNEKV